MDEDPFGSYGLRTVCLTDKPLFDVCFATCPARLSDYTFPNVFIWRDSIHLYWRLIHDCLCVFANGDGTLTMLLPPIGDGDVRRALDECLGICDAYNADRRRPHATRVEYVSEDLLGRLGGDLHVSPMSGDYIYETRRMIDLAGGDLASKRQARNRFLRRYDVRTEAFEARHMPHCLALLALWQAQALPDSQIPSAVQIKRAKEIAATADAMRHYRQLNLHGMVLYAGQEVAGFTLGEQLTADTCSILIEKTNREFTGSAQFIFSEFCRQYWSAYRWCNVGDDWDVPSLAWTKESYRPAARLPKFTVRPRRAAAALIPAPA